MFRNITTERLILRPFILEDACRIQALAGDQRVSEMTANIPHPYLDGMAESWIREHRREMKEGHALVYAITILNSGELAGAISLTEITGHDANLGYWLGVPYWGKGYCTEAARPFLRFCFSELKLPMIYARHLIENQASGSVIQKCGFQFIREVHTSGQGKSQILKHYELYNP